MYTEDNLSGRWYDAAISKDVFDGLNQNFDDLAFTADAAAGRMKSSQLGMFASFKAGFLGLKAQGLSTFAALTTSAAAFGATLMTALNVIGIIVLFVYYKYQSIKNFPLTICIFEPSNLTEPIVPAAASAVVTFNTG